MQHCAQWKFMVSAAGKGLFLMDYGVDPIKYGQAFQLFYTSLCEATGKCV